jgi:phage internal scaffolding protein
MKPPFLRTPYNYDRDQASNEHGLKCEDKTLTQQHFKDECDINTIVDRFHITGETPQLTELPSFGNFEGIFDYQTAMNAIVQARETFMTMPAAIRTRFDNDPQKFLAFCEDKENFDEAARLGIVDDQVVELRRQAKQAEADKAADERAAARSAAATPMETTQPGRPGPKDPKTNK